MAATPTYHTDDNERSMANPEDIKAPAQGEDITGRADDDDGDEFDDEEDEDDEADDSDDE